MDKINGIKAQDRGESEPGRRRGVRRQASRRAEVGIWKWEGNRSLKPRSGKRI